MQEIIAHIEKSVHDLEAFETEAFLELLDVDSHLHWKAHFPVAIVHHKSRVDEATALVLEREGVLDDEGFTRSEYSFEELQELSKEATNAFKQVGALCIAKESDSYRYAPKRPADKWKKVLDNGSFTAVVEVGVYDGESLCEIETKLRDLMRSSKEVPSLKPIGFVWVAALPKEESIDQLLTHYFGNCFLDVDCGDRHVYIGWNDTLSGVDMRHFVCPPAKEK